MKDLCPILKKLRNKRHLSVRNLVSGLCSPGLYSRIESGKVFPHLTLLRLILERLGVSFNKIELIVDIRSYRHELTYYKIGSLLENNQITKAARLLEESESDLCSPDHPYNMMMYYRYAAWINYAEERFDDALSNIEKAVSATVPFWYQLKPENLVISSSEIENILFLLHIKHEKLQVKNTEEKDSLYHIEVIKEYLELNPPDFEEYAVVFSKTCHVEASISVTKGDYDHAVSVCLSALELLRREEILYMMPAHLDTIITYGRDYPLPEPYENYVEYRYALAYAISSSSFAHKSYNMLLSRCNKTLYHLDYEVIKAERLKEGHTQFGLSESAYLGISSLSRVERGNVAMRSSNFKILCEKLDIKKERVNPPIFCISFDSVDLLHDIETIAAKGQTSDAVLLLEAFMSELDLEKARDLDFLNCFREGLSSSGITIKKAMTHNINFLDKYYPITERRAFRPPFLDEMHTIATLCTYYIDHSLRDDAINICQSVLDLLRKSYVSPVFQFKTYGLSNSILAGITNNPHYALKNLNYSLFTGSLYNIHACLGIIGCALFNNPTDRIKSKALIKSSYILARLDQRTDEYKKGKAFYDTIFTNKEGG